MSTKKSLLETKDVNGTVIKLGDKVAYPKSSYGGYNVKVHTGVVMRITDFNVWVLPDNQFKSDACEWKFRTTNGEPYWVPGTWKRNPLFKVTGYKKSSVYDWCMRKSESVLKLG